MAHLKINNPSKGVVSAACQKQPYIYIFLKKLSNTANPAGDTIFQWDPIVYLDWKSLSAKRVPLTNIIHDPYLGHLGKYMFKHTPKKHYHNHTAGHIPIIYP